MRIADAHSTLAKKAYYQNKNNKKNYENTFLE